MIRLILIGFILTQINTPAWVWAIFVFGCFVNFIQIILEIIKKR